MKRLNLLVIAVLISSPVMFAGGLVTNTNQSAAWARTLTREATLGIDGVYFNPAGLGLLEKGFHFSLSNQSIFQTRAISSDYTFLEGSPKSYEAELTAPFYPSIYAAYKLDKWAFSAGFNIIGGGGSANFEQGLPSFEIPVASLVPMMGSLLTPIDDAIEAATNMNPGFANVTGYNMNAAFNGSSNYYGIQLGATYAINEMISVAIGGRYVMANNSYEGSLTGVTIDAPEAYGGTMPPGTYVGFVGEQIAPLNPTIGEALSQAALGLDAVTADAELDAVQKGSGFTPIISLNLHLSDMINIAAKYEHHTKIELTNETVADDVGMFPDGEKTRADLPGMFSLGVQVKPLEKLTACVGFNYFLDKGAYYGNVNEQMEQINNESTIDENDYSINVSLEYKFLGILGVSAGYSGGNLGVNDDYQSDLRYALHSNSFAGGVFVDVGEIVTINAGFVYAMYDDYSKSQSYDLPIPPPMPPVEVPYNDTYSKSTKIFAIGVDISF